MVNDGHFEQLFVSVLVEAISIDDLRLHLYSFMGVQILQLELPCLLIVVSVMHKFPGTKLKTLTGEFIISSLIFILGPQMLKISAIYMGGYAQLWWFGTLPTNILSGCKPIEDGISYYYSLGVGLEGVPECSVSIPASNPSGE